MDPKVNKQVHSPFPVMNQSFRFMGWGILLPPLSQRHLTLVVIMSVFLLGACTTSQIKVDGVEANSSSLASPLSTSITMTPATADANFPPQFARLPRLNGKATVVMVVQGTPITIEVDGTTAPLTAGNFVDLVRRGEYDGVMFHRVIREPQPFVVQGGDPTSKDTRIPPEQLGTGGFIDPSSGKQRLIPLEITPEDRSTPVYSQTFKQSGITVPPKLRHTLGAVAMARSQFPDSASSQFYFALGNLGFLDGEYAVFGYVKEGMEKVNTIQQGDRIDSAKVTAGLENFNP